ncbi:hypothetical protein C8J56DRAFT_1036694 [Mycena floridula]|nr:hypothetical protein C8J56DRAFT_1036694 [Mycena floridula]
MTPPENGRHRTDVCRLRLTDEKTAPPGNGRRKEGDGAREERVDIDDHPASGLVDIDVHVKITLSIKIQQLIGEYNDCQRVEEKSNSSWRVYFALRLSGDGRGIRAHHIGTTLTSISRYSFKLDESIRIYGPSRIDIVASEIIAVGKVPDAAVVSGV